MRINDQAVALAGIARAAELVNRIARYNDVSLATMQPVIDTLFRFDADTALDVFGGSNALQPGVIAMLQFMDPKDRTELRQPMAYLMGMVKLQRLLARREDMLATIRQRLEQCQAQAELLQDNPSAQIGAIASLYQDTISTLPYRIQVTGEPDFLQQQANADKIRALLLAGIRAATLWHQVGGRQWHILLYHSRLTRALRGLRQ